MGKARSRRSSGDSQENAASSSTDIYKTDGPPAKKINGAGSNVRRRDSASNGVLKGIRASVVSTNTMACTGTTENVSFQSVVRKQYGTRSNVSRMNRLRANSNDLSIINDSLTEASCNSPVSSGTTSADSGCSIVSPIQRNGFRSNTKKVDGSCSVINKGDCDISKAESADASNTNGTRVDASSINRSNDVIRTSVFSSSIKKVYGTRSRMNGACIKGLSADLDSGNRDSTSVVSGKGCWSCSKKEINAPHNVCRVPSLGGTMIGVGLDSNHGNGYEDRRKDNAHTNVRKTIGRRGNGRRVHCARAKDKGAHQNTSKLNSPKADGKKLSGARGRKVSRVNGLHADGRKLDTTLADVQEISGGSDNAMDVDGASPVPRQSAPATGTEGAPPAPNKASKLLERILQASSSDRKVNRTCVGTKKQTEVAEKRAQETLQMVLKDGRSEPPEWIHEVIRINHRLEKWKVSKYWEMQQELKQLEERKLDLLQRILSSRQ